VNRETFESYLKRKEAKMAGEREPFLHHDAEDDDFGYNWADGDIAGYDDSGRFGCCFPKRCCMPGPHPPSECASVEMMVYLLGKAHAEEGDSA